MVKQTIMNENINILVMQETEINKNLDSNLLSFPGYYIETENNSTLARVAYYIGSRVDYVRRRDLEAEKVETTFSFRKFRAVP